MLRKLLAVALLMLGAIVCSTCATDDTPDPEPMPGYANPWIGTAASNPPANPQPKTPPAKTPQPVNTQPATQPASAPATSAPSTSAPTTGVHAPSAPAPRTPLFVQPNASGPVSSN